MSLKRYRLLLANAVLALALFGSYWGRRVEGATVSRADLLSRLSLPFRGWKTSDIGLSSAEMQMLQPDAVLVRRYHAPDGRWAELAVIAGHRKSTVHTPGFCMVGGGWEVLSKRAVTLALPGGSVEATQTVMGRQRQALVATYFFTDGSYTTRDLVRFDAEQLLKRFGRSVPLGALVRIIVPVSKSPAESVKLSDDFARRTVPPVLGALRQARLVMR